MNSIAIHTGKLAELLRARAEDGVQISEVFLVACGGSLVDLYPAKFFLESESCQLRTGFYTSNEFVHAPPKVLGGRSVVVLCSHSGDTPETVEAAKASKAAGALTVTLTYNKSSRIRDFADYNIVYEWGDETSVQNNPMAIALALCLEVLQHSEGYAHYSEFQEALSIIDTIVKRACDKVSGPATGFAVAYRDQSLFYILSSGASYGHAYGFAICSLMEMQWLNAGSIHSGEFFHGPFEITDEKTNFIVLVNEGRTRPLDLRVVDFLKKYAGRYVVVDARDLGIGALPGSVVEFFNPVLFYSVICVYREALAKLRGHPLETRRYMGKVDY